MKSKWCSFLFFKENKTLCSYQQLQSKEHKTPLHPCVRLVLALPRCLPPLCRLIVLTSPPSCFESPSTSAGLKLPYAPSCQPVLNPLPWNGRAVGGQLNSGLKKICNNADPDGFL